MYYKVKINIIKSEEVIFNGKMTFETRENNKDTIKYIKKNLKNCITTMLGVNEKDLNKLDININKIY